MSIIIVLISIIITVVLLATDTDTGDFKIKYKGGSKKYESSIKSGINRWSSIGTGGVSLTFDTYSENTNTLARTIGRTIEINEHMFNGRSGIEKILTIAHEVGHALGIGVGWQNKYLSDINSGVPYLSDTLYPKTAKTYIDKVRPAGKTIPGPALHNTGEPGSKYVHWDGTDDYGTKRDLMTATISTTSSVISELDLVYLEEIGKTVDITQGQTLYGTYFSLITGMIIGDNEIKDFCGNCSGCLH